MSPIEIGGNDGNFNHAFSWLCNTGEFLDRSRSSYFSKFDGDPSNLALRTIADKVAGGDGQVASLIAGLERDAVKSPNANPHIISDVGNSKLVRLEQLRGLVTLMVSETAVAPIVRITGPGTFAQA